MENQNNTKQHKHLPSDSYTHREGSHLREVLQSFLHSPYIHTFRDPLSPEWEIPHEEYPHWTPERWERLAADWADGIGHEQADPMPGSTHHPDALHVSTEWARLAHDAWGCDEAVRALATSLALARVDVWSTGDKRRGRMRADATKLGGELRIDALRIDAFVPHPQRDEPSYRMPSALELSRELGGLWDYEAHRTRMTDVPGAIADAGASIVALLAANRLRGQRERREAFNGEVCWIPLDARPLFFEATRRAVCTLIAAQTHQELALLRAARGAAADHEPTMLRDVRAAVLRTWSSKVRAHRAWMTPEAIELAAAAAEERADDVARKAERASCCATWPGDAFAARLRGYEHPMIASAPESAFAPEYLLTEPEEERAPLPRPRAKKKGKQR